MDSPLMKCCRELLTDVVGGCDKETLMTNCIREKLSTIYARENAEFDEMLDKLDRYIDYNSETQVRKCINRITKLLSRHRKQLFKVLRKVL